MSVSARNNALQICILLFLTLSMFSCEPSRSELPGTYVADYDVAREKLVLNKDGTYVQEVTLKSNLKVDVSRGRWSYDQETQYVTFEDFMFVINAFGELNPDYTHRKRGIFIAPAKMYFGRMRIGSSERVSYKKTD